MQVQQSASPVFHDEPSCPSWKPSPSPPVSRQDPLVNWTRRGVSTGATDRPLGRHGGSLAGKRQDSVRSRHVLFSPSGEKNGRGRSLRARVTRAGWYPSGKPANICKQGDGDLAVAPQRSPSPTRPHRANHPLRWRSPESLSCLTPPRTVQKRYLRREVDSEKFPNYWGDVPLEDPCQDWEYQLLLDLDSSPCVDWGAEESAFKRQSRSRVAAAGRLPSPCCIHSGAKSLQGQSTTIFDVSDKTTTEY